MVHQLSGVSGGDVELIEDEIREANTNIQTQITSNTNNIANLIPKYMLLQVNTTATGNIGWSIFPTATTHELSSDFTYGTPAAGCFTKSSAGSNYYLFQFNIPMDVSGPSTLATITVRHKPTSGAEYTYYAKTSYISNGQAETIDFSFTLKMNQTEYFAIQTANATLTSAAANRGYCQITKLG